MNPRPFLLGAAIAAVVAGGAYHWQAMRTRAAMESGRQRVMTEAKEKQRLHDEDSRQAESARKQLEAILAKRTEAATRAANVIPNPPASNSPAPSVRAGALDLEMRRLEMQEFVSNQRLRYGALLARLGFTPEKQQAFDRILGTCEEMRRYDSSQERQRAATEVRDAQLRELFGANYDQWLAAGRNQPARNIVNQLVTLTFQSSGALNTAQADDLTGIFARHRVPPEERQDAQSEFDWDRILADAHPLLTEQQRKDLGVAVEYRRASAQMTAMAAKKN